MSASLVGSEMCIRDRLEDRQARCATMAIATAREVARNQFVAYAWRRSVSYTHLTLPTICSV
eukprot:497202-Alexandrium_andersonii.AAC.1